MDFANKSNLLSLKLINIFTKQATLLLLGLGFPISIGISKKTLKNPLALLLKGYIIISGGRRNSTKAKKEFAGTAVTTS